MIYVRKRLVPYTQHSRLELGCVSTIDSNGANDNFLPLVSLF